MKQRGEVEIPWLDCTWICSQMEAQDQSSGRWDFFRICHLNVDAACELQAGVFANAPIAAGGSIVFRYLKFEHTQGYDHKAT